MDFEKADLQSTSPVAGPPCALCQRGIVGRYFQAGQAMLCPSCADAVQQGHAKGGAFLRVVKATAFGFGAGLLGTLVYAAVLYGLHIQAALITIGIGWLVGRGVMAGSEHRGGVGYQVLAAVMTYVMCNEALAPSIYSGAMSSPDAPPAFLAGMFAIVLAPAAPFLGDFDPLGLAILGFGVWQGWKTPKAPVIVVTGPFELAPPAAVVAPIVVDAPVEASSGEDAPPPIEEPSEAPAELQET